MLKGYDRGMRRDLVRLFGGDVSAAEEAIADLCETPDLLAGWATKMIRREDPEAPEFSWDEVPENIKATAIRGMAMAFLLQSWGGVTREHLSSAVAAPSEQGREW